MGHEFSRILLTNDDGIDAPGLAALETIATALAGELWIVAPLLDQSGTSASLTMNEPLRLMERRPRRFAVGGTPSDCVALALKHLMPQPPDLVLSGVNRGANLGDEVTYSGTVGGAITAALLGCRAMALSQAYTRHGEYRWHTAAALAPPLITRLARMEWPPDACLNINFPDAEPHEVAGIAATVQARRTGTMEVQQRTDLRGLDYFWLKFRRHGGLDSFGPANSDGAALARRQIAITPIRFDRTHEEMRLALADLADSFA